MYIPFPFLERTDTLGEFMTNKVPELETGCKVTNFLVSAISLISPISAIAVSTVSIEHTIVAVAVSTVSTIAVSTVSIERTILSLLPFQRFRINGCSFTKFANFKTFVAVAVSTVSN